MQEDDDHTAMPGYARNMKRDERDGFVSEQAAGKIKLATDDAPIIQGLLWIEHTKGLLERVR